MIFRVRAIARPLPLFRQSTVNLINRDHLDPEHTQPVTQYLIMLGRRTAASEDDGDKWVITNCSKSFFTSKATSHQASLAGVSVCKKNYSNNLFVLLVVIYSP